MKTCTNGLPCPTQLQCGIGCFFNEADTNSNYFHAMNAPLHSKNGGNTIDHGEALSQIEHDARRTVAAWTITLGVLWLAVLSVLIVRII